MTAAATPSGAAPILLRVISYNVGSLRYDVAAVAEVVRGLDPDIAVIQEAPRRLRWRSRCAELARRCGLVYAAGGQPALGNLVLTSYRVGVGETWCVQFPLTPGRHLRGAVFARCTVGPATFVVAGSHLATDPVERPAQAAVLKRELTAVATPLILGADLNETPDGGSWRLVAAGLCDPGADVAAPTYPAARAQRRLDAILTDARVGVRDYQVVDTPLSRRASDHFPVLAELVFAPDWTNRP
jgi:endonuclease/exonuclease/phosphatase family metal-dependent hydrolase